tara:strand:- start:533 stop:1075 length:543 start_codon:yes stop_codon:yes gene_type:complete
MNILAVYDHEQLELPSKVLTHREDIDPLLSVLGVRLESIEPVSGITPKSTDQQILEAARSSLASSAATTVMEHMAVQRVDAAPGYATEPHNIAVEQSVAQALALLLVKGAGVICLHHHEQLLVLSCRRGDMLLLPKHLAHWFVASAGQPSLIVHASETQDGLLAKPTGNDIAQRYQVLEL